MHKTITIILLVEIISSYIKIPFYTYNIDSKNNLSDYFSMQNFVTNNIYSHLLIGNPPQKITSKLNFNAYAFNIYNNQCDIPSEYNTLYKNSTTKINKGYILTDVYIDTFLIEDFFAFPEYPDKSFKLNYIYAPMDNNLFEKNIERKLYTCANIGLKLSVNYAGTFDYNFLRELKNLNIINNYVFYFDYDNNNKEEGNLIIGKWPHEIDENKDKYKEKIFKEVYAINYEFNLCWMIRVDDTFLKIKEDNSNKKYNLTKNSYFELDYNLNIIYGAYEFMELIEKIYFNEKIENKICKKVYSNNGQLIFFECDPSLNIKSFPSIFFNHKTFSFIFELNYEDLFKINDGKLIFLIWFKTKEKEKWSLGKIFLKKYLFTFDIDKKMIGFYTSKNNIFDNTTTDENNTKYIVIKLILFSFIAFFLCFILAKVYFRHKKEIRNNNKLTELINIK